MDRFIGDLLGDLYMQLNNLKSNMDRFIAGHIVDTSFENLYLKSNMDRFIGFYICINCTSFAI